jgi:hypothetical protein
VAEHPFAVQFAMLARVREPVKSARLRRAGLDPESTSVAVQRGLRALAARQDTDGSFPRDGSATSHPAGSPAGALGTVGRTGLALLPFLAEGRSSAPLSGGGRDGVVAPGIRWLREKLSRADALPAGDLALGVLALTEDYMLAYGRWSAAEARARAEELRGLGERLAALQRADGSFEGQRDASGEMWPLLALDGVRHAGLALPTTRATERLGRWLGERQGDPARGGDALARAGHLILAKAAVAAPAAALPEAEADARVLLTADLAGRAGPLTALATSLALYRRAPVAFRDWNRTQGDGLRARLGPSGLVADGDPVGDTALVLLALQSAYRSY